LALGTGILAYSCSTPKVTAQLPAFSLADMHGAIHSSSEWEGRVRVINFWATWCPPCIKEIPEFVRLQDELAEGGVQFIGIALDNPESVREFAAIHRINYPSLVAEMDGFALVNRLGNKNGALPYTVVVDASGKLVYQHIGIVQRKDLLAVINRI